MRADKQSRQIRCGCQNICALNFRKPGHLRKYCNNENFPIYGIIQPTVVSFVMILKNPKTTFVILCGCLSCWWLCSLPSHTGSSISVANSTSSTVSFSVLDTSGVHNAIINPRRACARVTVLVLSVCLCVCFPYTGTSRNQAYNSTCSVCVSVCVFSLYWHLAQSGVQTAVSATSARYGMKYKKGFFFKTLRSEVMASFTHLE